MHLSEAAAITQGVLRGDDDRFCGVVIDSRQTERGDLFVAIAGADRDGHDFVAQAGEGGAAGALVSGVGPDAVPQIQVPDTTAALGQLGADWRQRFSVPLVAVTGSNGKTTVSALIAAIFNHGGCCLAPRASFNNQWGVPLTLLRLREHHTHAVIEMGMNQPGELENLSALAAPDVALINNVAPAHLAGFADLADLTGIAAAKAEILTGLSADGVVVLNADDGFYDYWRERAGRRTVLDFGIHNPATVSASNISPNPRHSVFELHLGERGQRSQRSQLSERGEQGEHRISVRLPLPGRHNVLNAAAAAAAAFAVGATPAQIKAGLESCNAIDARLHPRDGLNGALVIDDSYNANPQSARAALEVLAGFGGERIAVFGVMAELGARSAEWHRETGRWVRDCGIEHFLCLGPEDSGAVAGYRRGFGDGTKCFTALAPLLAYLAPMLGAGVTVLVKGSRAAAMERVVAALLKPHKAHKSHKAHKKTGGGATC